MKKEMHYVESFESEPLILERDDFAEDEWFLVCHIFGMYKADRIVIKDYKFEAWGIPNKKLIRKVHN